MVTFKVYVQKMRQDGYWPVYIRVTHNRKIEYMPTQYMANAKQLKGSEVIDPFILKECYVKIDGFINKLNRVNHKSWTTKEIRKYLEGIDEEISFSNWCNTFYGKMINVGRNGTAKNYKLAIRRLEEFAQKENLLFSDITSKLINGWIESMSDSKRKKSSYPKAIKTMFNAGIEEFNDYDRNIIKIKNQPFRVVKMVRQDVTKKRAISKEQILKFFNTDISPLLPPKGGWITRAERAKDVCLMVLCLAGINTADLYFLKKVNLNEWKLSYNRRKTTSRRNDDAYIEITVPERIRPIFEKYFNQSESDSLFIFDKIYRDHDGFNGAINKGIADILELNGMDYISTYTFRHSWATIAQNDCGARTEDVAFALNHSSAHRVTEGYIKKDFSRIDKLNTDVLNFIFKPTKL